MNPKQKIICADAIEGQKQLESESIDMCITSPPYWSLRDYGKETSNIVWGGKKDCKHIWNSKDRKIHSGKTKSTIQASVDKLGGFATDWETTDSFCSKCCAWKGQLGLEPDFKNYIFNLADVFDETFRVLKPSGSLWVNIGDTYYTKSGSNFENDNITGKTKQQIDNTTGISKANEIRGKGLLPSKCLVGIPFRFATEMMNRGWILRNTIIWYKSSCMPSSSKDRFTVDFEYLFFFVKNQKYYFEQQLEPLAESTLADKRLDKGLVKHKTGKTTQEECQYSIKGMCANLEGRNKRTVWNINPKPFKESHFAVFPEELLITPFASTVPKEVCCSCGKPREKMFKYTQREPEEKYVGFATKDYEKHQAQNPSDTKRRILESMAKEREFLGYSKCLCNAGFKPATVLDPFLGSGTTLVVAKKLGVNGIGIDLKKEYCLLAYNRLTQRVSNPKKQTYLNNPEDIEKVGFE